MARETEEEKAQKRVEKIAYMHEKAGYKWIDKDVTDEYRKKALALGDNPTNVGGMRQLCDELQHIYGLVEVEALNILNGHNVNDYISKYYRLQHRIPTLLIRRKEYEDDDNQSNEDWS